MWLYILNWQINLEKTDQNCYKQKLKNQNNPTPLKKSVVKDHLTNKTPGPNGFPGESLQTFQNAIIPFYINSFGKY